MRLSVLRPAADANRLIAPDAITRRELYFFDLYRVFQSVLLLGFCFSPLADRMIVLVTPLTAQMAALAYVLGAVALFLQGRRARGDRRRLVYLGLVLDLLAATTALNAINGLDSGIAALTLVTVACSALLLPLGGAFAFAFLAAMVVLGALGLQADATPGAWTEGILFGIAYLVVTGLLQLLRRQVHETEERVQQQESDLANLTQLNDLIIRRMRTGVVVVDAGNQIHQVNEAAWTLMGNPAPQQRDLAAVAPEVSRRLYHWRTFGKADATPITLAEGMPEVIPRFARLGAGNEDNTIVFLDDISLLSRQAEQMTLSSLGRLSASIAHEIRNPLAAISYSAQLLAESGEIGDADQRLVEIVRAQCTRVNTIVENILQLSRRERSKPEQIDLSAWTVAFVDEYRGTQPQENDEVRAVVPPRPVQALVDPGQLQQVVWNLVQNARRYGRLPGEPARVAVVARRLAENGPPVVEVVDRGPGIPKKVANQIFDPFYTTSEHGTGLGLYIARQLCEANQGALDYVPVAGGGSCFRITLASALAPAKAAPVGAPRGGAGVAAG
ncbi:MAG: HAMP domain-containing histidine kinase [Xanthomonadaceae bacterium]|jgi:two-component system sensor histidine kinase PilS (NtrC family)|nr:HAMP domain-containing histidine kinase [Xanthomonadaceae bacterium]